ILDNMTMGTDYAAGLSATGLSGVYAMVVHNGSRESLLLVNTNTDTGLNLTVPVTAFPVGGPGAEWSWGPTESAPSYDRVGSLPESYQVPPQGILLLDNY
ncbi:MAG: hypothetical protein L3J91_07000, partial [Thermoplasmata archaeon]|nr:hypothetical protein [Thermoplasmata archaeon]